MGHQPVLVGIVHVMQLQVRVGLQQSLPGRAAELKRLCGLVDPDPLLLHRD